MPFAVYKIRENGRMEKLASDELPGKYSVKDGYARSKDGTRVHYFFVAKTGTSPKKALLFSYGGFRVSLTPTFNPSHTPTLRRRRSLRCGQYSRRLGTR